MTTIRIAFFGDSITNGTNDPECLGWVGRAAAAAWRRGHDVTVYNLGVRRETSADIRARWEAEAAPRLRPGVAGGLVFAFGVNDCTIEGGRRRIDTAATAANAAAILARATALAPTLMIGPTPVARAGDSAPVADLVPPLRDACDRAGVPFLDVLPALADAGGAWMREIAAGDGAHPGAAGYAALAAVVDAWPAWRAWLP